MFTQKPVQECSLSVLFIITITWKQPKCTSMGEWINKLWNVHTMEHYQAKWMNYWYTDLDESQRHYAEWKKPTLKDYMLCDYICMTFSTKQNYTDGKQISDCWRLWVEVGVTINGRYEEVLGWWSCSLSRLWWWLHESTWFTITELYTPQKIRQFYCKFIKK